MTAPRITKANRWTPTAFDAWLLSGCAAGASWLALVYLCRMETMPAALIAAMSAYGTLAVIIRRRPAAEEQDAAETQRDPRNPGSRSQVRCLLGALTAVGLLILGAAVAVLCALCNQPAPGPRAQAARNAIVGEWRRGWAGAVNADVTEPTEAAVVPGQEVDRG